MVYRGDVIPAGDIFRFLKDFWESYNIQAIVLASLAFQIVLIFAAPSRKRTKSNSCILTLWTIYLLADYFATFAIGLINNGSSIGTNGNNDNNSGGYESCGTIKRSNIAALWAPFLLLHLGGPDTITAFAVEDNELWIRHLLGLLVQVLSVLLVFYRYHILQYEFRIPTALAFIAGVIKYAERTYSLNLAALANLKKSMRKDPDPGPDYAQLMEEMASKQAANVPVKIDINREKGAKDEMDEDGTKKPKELDELEVIQHGFKFFKTFKGLIVDHMFSFLERDESRKFYLSLNNEEAFRVMEMELNFIYDAMFTKMSAIRGWIGYAFRFICTSLLVAATVLFARHSHHDIHQGDITVTYFLLAGGVALDFIAIVELIFSKWTVALLLGDSDTSFGGRGNWRNRAATMISRVKELFRTKRWSEEMHQYSLINHCLKNQNRPNWVYNITEFFGLTENIDSCLYRKTRGVEDELKRLIFDEIKKKGKQAKKTSVAKEISSSKGEWTLLDYNCGPEIHLTVSQDVDYDQCVLMWHIATEIFYFSSKPENPPNGEVDDADICRYMSEYLLYLLVMERKMTTGVAGIVETRFRDTCQEAMNFFNRGQPKQNFFSRCSLPTFEKAKEACGLYFSSMVRSTWNDIKYVFTLGFFFTARGRKREQTKWEEHQNREEDRERRKACDMLKSVTPQVKPAEVKGDRSKSLLFDACILADNLKHLYQNNTYTEKEVWVMMSKVWVELLSYGACHCRGDAHAQYLSKGGELLTFVWLLMAHFGLGDQFRIEAGHARAKLIVGKE